MYSRRQFVTRSGASLSLLLAGLEGLPAWPQAPGAKNACVLNAGPGLAPFLGSFLAHLDPGSDVFLTETYAAQIEGILVHWTAACPIVPALVHAIGVCLQPTITASDLGQPNLRMQRAQSPLQTEQVTFGDPVAQARGAFVVALQAYFVAFGSISTAQFQVGGIVAATEPAHTLDTEIFYDVLGTLHDGRREQRTGVWQVQWTRSGDADWTIAGWRSQHESRSRLTGHGFIDVTNAVLGSNPSLARQMNLGADHWRTKLDGAIGIDVYGNNGIAVGDFDGDGHDDVYVCQAAGLPNRLYRNTGDGTLVDVTEQAGVGVLDATSSALFADLNNNGHQDLIVVRTTGPLLFINRGDGTFQPRKDAFQFARPPRGTFTAAAIADFDRDGLLDVYFCLYSYYQGPSEYRFPQPYYDARNGPPNFLFRNRGDYTFQDVTVPSGMDANNDRYSFACGWNDFDNDGWPDLYVVNDFGRKNLYRNRRDGTFTDVSAEAGVEDSGAGMSVCWFDFDNDGHDDLYVANMWTAEGRRISEQKTFLPAAPEPVRRVYRKHATGNSLFHNAGDGHHFENRADASGTRLGGWSWSSDAWDFDHDGYPDLYVTNGFVSGPDRADLSSLFWRQVVARSLASGGAATDYEDAWSAINEFLRSNRTWSGYESNIAYINNGDGNVHRGCRRPRSRLCRRRALVRRVRFGRRRPTRGGAEKPQRTAIARVAIAPRPITSRHLREAARHAQQPRRDRSRGRAANRPRPTAQVGCRRLRVSVAKYKNAALRPWRRDFRNLVARGTGELAERAQANLPAPSRQPSDRHRRRSRHLHGHTHPCAVRPCRHRRRHHPGRSLRRRSHVAGRPGARAGIQFARPARYSPRSGQLFR